jgi:uncharacterized protein YbaP (TraB family)
MSSVEDIYLKDYDTVCIRQKNIRMTNEYLNITAQGKKIYVVGVLDGCA